MYTRTVMLEGAARRTGRRWVLAALAAYAILLAANPLLHHDVACHQKSPTHCAACTSSPWAGRIEAVSPVAERPLPAAGYVEGWSCDPADSAAILQSTGRSPPA
jgi:hypothetical protein